MTPAEQFLDRTRYYLGVEYPAKIREALYALPPDKLWWRPNGSANSAGNLVLHLSGNVRQWVISGVGGAPDVRERDAEFAAIGGGSASQLIEVLEHTLSEVDAVLARVMPEQLNESRSIQGRTTTVLSALYHVTEHFSTHTGQIIWIAKMFAPEGSLKFYDDARNAAPLFLENGRSDI